MKQNLFIILIWSWSIAVFAQNPICPIGTYIADPTARVWPDGKLYIYGSTDESIDHWCSCKHDVLFSNDLQQWKMKTNVFASKGKADSISGTDALLFAPDAMYRNGKYYLYFCTPDILYSEGVAISNSPFGPFGQSRKMNVGNLGGIDPTVFVDDDGQAYYYWGQSTMRGAKLKADMVTLDTASIRDGLLTEKEHFFHEGSFVFKRNNIYYAVFADDSRRDGRPTCLGYATSKSPLGPFTYRGIIIDNFGCDPESWNNHGSIAEYQGKWYVFYHRSSHASKVMRRACVEPIKFNSDGTINEVEMTSQGAAQPLQALQVIEAERACFLKGYCRIELMEKDNEIISDIKNNDMAAYKYINFGNGVDSMKVRAYSFNGGTIKVYVGGPKGKLIGKLIIPHAGIKRNYLEYVCRLNNTKGVQSLWLEFTGNEDGTKLFDIDKFLFAKRK